MAYSRLWYSDIYLYLSVFDTFELFVARRRSLYLVPKPILNLLWRIAKKINKPLLYRLYSLICDLRISYKFRNKYAGTHYKFPIEDYEELIKLLKDMKESGLRFDLEIIKEIEEDAKYFLKSTE